MRRTIDIDLDRWKDDPFRLPLIIRGARQVGKSYSVMALGKRAFLSTATVNFEKREEFCRCFDTLDPRQIVRNLEVLLGQPIQSGKTLLFLDEVQICPRAITALRYFKEEMPELHVIAAGSLLEFVINDQNFSFPVGRVQFLYMRPLSFVEFLEATAAHTLVDYLQESQIDRPPPEVIHNEFLNHIRSYTLLGGMPEVVRSFIETTSYLKSREIQNQLLQAYTQDFGKYSTRAQSKTLQRLFERSPQFVGYQVKYSKIDPESSNPAREYKHAIQLLTNAGLISPIYMSSANGIPLEAQVNEKKFKLLFLDVGLFQAALNVEPNVVLREDEVISNRGTLAEQLVGQELIAYMDPTRDAKLFFWEREKAHSHAEVDYVTAIEGKIVPIEVKAGAIGHLKSLRQFMIEKKINYGVKISESGLGKRDQILSIPFYLISQLFRFVR